MSISLSNTTVLASGVSPPMTTVTAGYELHADGSIWQSVNGTKTNIGSWDTIANQGSLYECIFAFQSGSTLTQNSASTWTNMGTIQSFALTKGVGNFSSIVTVEIRDKVTHGVQATASITLHDLLSH